MSTLLDRRGICQDRLLRERVAQAILETGAQSSVDAVIVVLAQSVTKASEISDAEIIAAVGSEIDLKAERAAAESDITATRA